MVSREHAGFQKEQVTCLIRVVNLNQTGFNLSLKTFLNIFCQQKRGEKWPFVCICSQNETEIYKLLSGVSFSCTQHTDELLFLHPSNHHRGGRKRQEES